MAAQFCSDIEMWESLSCNLLLQKVFSYDEKL